MDTLSELGVPLNADRGPKGGVRLLPGYFVPALMFTQQEAVALLVGLALEKSLSVSPFRAEQATAEQKLLQVLPEAVRRQAARTDRFIGFELTPNDTFHPEMGFADVSQRGGAEADPGITLSGFVQAILDRHPVHMGYASPYRPGEQTVAVEPLGIFWDRERWYLAARSYGQDSTIRVLRLDRVRNLEVEPTVRGEDREFDIRTVLARRWLDSAMAAWIREVPVKIRVSSGQRARLSEDWYYRHAHFEPDGDGFVMTFGERNPDFVLELLRWLGPGAELLEPRAWRCQARAELERMLECYRSDPD